MPAPQAPAPGERPGTLAFNSKNLRGPRGANLAFFCIPNTFTDQIVYDYASPYGNIVFCKVATHADTGNSRGYAFVSFDSIENAQACIAGAKATPKYFQGFGPLEVRAAPEPCA